MFAPRTIGIEVSNVRTPEYESAIASPIVAAEECINPLNIAANIMFQNGFFARNWNTAIAASLSLRGAHADRHQTHSEEDHSKAEDYRAYVFYYRNLGKFFENDTERYH